MRWLAYITMVTMVTACCLLSLTRVTYAQTTSYAEQSDADQAHCTAAYHAEDDSAILQWCTVSAEDYDIEAGHQSGEARFQSMLMEGIDLVDVSMAAGLLHDPVRGRAVARNARTLFEAILAGSHDERIRNTAQSAMKNADDLIDLNAPNAP